jgi:short-subunit dehydrogenase
MALYGATKAFVLSFTEALGGEVREQGVRVLALCPGETATGFFDAAQGGATGAVRRPEQVVASGLHALERGRGYTIDGWQNYLLAQLPRFVPRSLVVRFAARIARGAAEASAPHAVASGAAQG